MKKPLRGSSLEDQLTFVDYELNNGNGGKDLRGATTARDAAFRFEKGFERSGGSALDKRMENAEKLMGGNTQNALDVTKGGIPIGQGVNSPSVPLAPTQSPGISKKDSTNPMSMIDSFKGTLDDVIKNIGGDNVMRNYKDIQNKILNGGSVDLMNGQRSTGKGSTTVNNNISNNNSSGGKGGSGNIEVLDVDIYKLILNMA